MRKMVVRFGPVLGLLLVLAGPARAVNDAQIRHAIKNAIDFLRSVPIRAMQPGNPDDREEGPAALLGIAMMEAGVPASDAGIQNIAKVIREQAIKQSKTYQLALDIIFLDKLGEEIDTTLIQSMGVRLLGGQSLGGTWSYKCPEPDDQEKDRLSKALNGAMKSKGSPDQVGADPSKRPKLDPSLDGQRNRKSTDNGDGDDMSNTQFAILGVWAARRHGLPVDDALGRLDRKVRGLQNGNGGWAYRTSGPGVNQPTMSMTAAGLLGLAITTGQKGEHSMKAAVLNPDGTVKAIVAQPKKIPNPLTSDVQVQKGFAYIAQAISGSGNAGIGPSIGNVGPGGPGGGGTEPAGMGIRGDYYTMWSMERVCMVYSFPARLGDKDWYAWGADDIVKAQKPNGCWMGGKNYGAEIDTSFALMFLVRSNIVKDLSDILGNKMKSHDPNKVKPSTGVPTVKGSDKPADATDPAAMAKALAAASGEKYADLLKQYTEAKGPAFTQALATAIPLLSGESQKRVREALADRMSRFSAATLKERLHDPDAEMRRASALAVCMREERELVPDLIDALNDPEDIVVRGARTSLREFSDKKEDFGPPPGASAEQKRQAAAAWKAWWTKQIKQ